MSSPLAPDSFISSISFFSFFSVSFAESKHFRRRGGSFCTVYRVQQHCGGKRKTQDSHDFFCGTGIQITGWLIGQNNRRRLRDRPCESNTMRQRMERITGGGEMSALVEIRDICKVYNPGENEVRALDHVDLTIHEKEFVAIIGQSGSGKSTLMNMLAIATRCCCPPDISDGLWVFRFASPTFSSAVSESRILSRLDTPL